MPESSAEEHIALTAIVADDISGPSVPTEGSPAILWLQYEHITAKVSTEGCTDVFDLTLAVQFREESLDVFQLGNIRSHFSLHVTLHSPALPMDLLLADIKDQPDYIESSAQSPLHLKFISTKKGILVC